MTAPYIIRPFVQGDLDGVTQVEAASFPGQPTYPNFFFAQAGDVLAPSFFVASHAISGIVGYVIALRDEREPRVGWILSVAVHPSHQRKGLGAALLQLAEERLRAWGCRVSQLTVDPQNSVALHLYETAGYATLRFSKDYLGRGVHRLIMRKQLLEEESSLPLAEEGLRRGPSQAKYEPHLLLEEAQSSISFVNVLFTVSLAVLAITVDQLRENLVVGLILFLIVISSFYGSIFYAVVAGNVARLGKQRDAERAIQYGNILSEYFGVYLVVVAFPLMVEAVARSTALTYLAVAVNSLGFIFYSIGEFSLISRPIPRRWSRWTFSGLFLALSILLTVGQSEDMELLTTVSAIGVLMLIALATILHLSRGEGTRGGSSTDKLRT